MNLNRARLKGVAGLACIIGLAILISRCSQVQRFYAVHAPVWSARVTLPPKNSIAALIVSGARAQIGTIYDAGYETIAYPSGDVSSDKGACADVIVRAFRHAGFDLQRLIHEDMAANFEAYPKLDGLTQPDSNIDHRRVLIQIRFLERHAVRLTEEVSHQTLPEWQPGDVVYWKVFGEHHHAGILSDRGDSAGVPLVIHNGSVCIEQDCLTKWKIIGHFRFPNSRE